MRKLNSQSFYQLEPSKRQRLLELSKKKVLRGKLSEDLALYTPWEVLDAIKNNTRIVKWHTFLAEHYRPPEDKKIALFYPCSTVKPYYLSRTYTVLDRTLKGLGKLQERIHILTVSEPFAIVPKEFHKSWMYWYDCPGLFEWWCRRYGIPYDNDIAREAIECLSEVIAKYLSRVAKRKYDYLVAFVRTWTSHLKGSEDHTHKRILMQASKKSGIPIRILPDKELIAKIVREHGHTSWDFWGVAHPTVQRLITDTLFRLLK